MYGCSKFQSKTACTPRHIHKAAEESNPTHFWNNQNNHSTKQDTSLRSKSLFNILHNMIYLVTLLHLLIGYDLQLALSVERILIDSNFFELSLNIF